MDFISFGKPLNVSALKPGNFWCRGPVAGGGCPYNLGTRVGSKCGHMHADYTTDLNNIRTSWEEAQMHTDRQWHSGLNADMLVSFIFEFSANHLVFRCKFCHSKLPHYQHFISKRDLAGEGSHAHPIVIEDDS